MNLSLDLQDSWNSVEMSVWFLHLVLDRRWSGLLSVRVLYLVFRLFHIDWVVMWVLISSVGMQ